MPSPTMPKLPPGLRYEESGRVATITLSRPERLNALTFEIYEALVTLFDRLARRPDLGAIVLTGEGRAFSSGGDTQDIIKALLGRSPEELHRFTKMTCDVVAKMRACPQPIVAALNGLVAGAGAALAVASDLRVAVPEAKIAFLFVKAGLSGADMGCALLLPRIVGHGRAAELLYFGDFITADEAHRIGLYNHVVPGDQLLPKARELAQRLADGPADGIPLTKASLDQELSMPLTKALDYEARVQGDLMQHPDFREANDAFREKRPPRFGRASRRAADDNG